MTEGKFYWLKLDKDFFKRHDIRIIEDMKNGKDYILFYLKLLLESLDHDGALRFSDEIPYSENMLATITNTNPDTVRSAIKVFSELRMMEIMDDGTYYMNQVNKMVGSETKWAQQKRIQRERTNKVNESIEMKADNVLSVSAKCPTEKEIEKEKEIEIEKESKEKKPCQQIADMYNDTCVSLPRCTRLSDSRLKALKARLRKYSLDDFKLLFEKAEASDFLKGSNGRDWSANFDWLIKDANMAKVLDGNYDNSSGPVRNKSDPNDYWAEFDRIRSKDD